MPGMKYVDRSVANPGHPENLYTMKISKMASGLYPMPEMVYTRLAQGFPSTCVSVAGSSFHTLIPSFVQGI